MTNLDLIIQREPLSAEGRAALQRVLDVIDHDPRRIIRRFRFRVGPFGLLRPSFALRAQHFRGFVEWLLATPDEVYEPEETEEQAE